MRVCCLLFTLRELFCVYFGVGFNVVDLSYCFQLVLFVCLIYFVIVVFGLCV